MGEMIILWVSEGARVGPGDACMLEAERKREGRGRRPFGLKTASDRRLQERERQRERKFYPPTATLSW